MTKRVIVHVDDVGMCHGANRALAELSAAGAVDGGSVMVPCPWFSEVVDMTERQDGLDLGIHLTLNAEKDHYRWRPLTAPTPASGLVDQDGFLWQTVALLREHCHPEAAEAEMRAQIDLAQERGIRLTHLDAHMFAALSPEYCEGYLRIGDDYGLPIMLTETFDGRSMPVHLEGVDEEPYRDVVRRARGAGRVVFDSLIETDWAPVASPRSTLERLFGAVGEGLTYMALHPNAPGELEFIEPETAAVRIGEYETFSDPGFAQWTAGLDLERVSWSKLD